MSKIEWTESTCNPITGCDRVSPGCDRCYALTQAARLKAMGQPRYQKDGNAETSGPGFGLQCHSDLLSKPSSWRKPRLVFVNSMSDMFHPDVPDSFILEIFDAMNSASQHTYQILTKRSQRLKKMASVLPWSSRIWMGVSIESQRYAFRAEHLKATDAHVKFISAEPLLSEISLNLNGIDWVIAGGESGSGFRPVKPEWVRKLRDECMSADVPFFFKQWGGRYAKAGGRNLDGRTWDEMPKILI